MQLQFREAGYLVGMGGMPFWYASVRFWVSDTVPHPVDTGQIMRWNQAGMFLFPADRHASCCRRTQLKTLNRLRDIKNAKRNSLEEREVGSGNDIHTDHDNPPSHIRLLIVLVPKQSARSLDIIGLTDFRLCDTSRFHKPKMALAKPRAVDCLDITLWILPDAPCCENEAQTNLNLW